MQRSFSRLSLPVVICLSLLSPVLSGAVSANTAPSTLPAQSDFIEARQFHWTNARLPGRDAAHQNITAWQVSHGAWDGETLDGLSLVLVQSTLESGAGQRLVNCYVSCEATLAQRAALVTAFLASQGSAVAINRDSMRIESAVITLEIQGQTIVLHLGLIA